MNDFIIGCHIGLSKPDYFLASVKEALSYGANAFMFYTGAPQNTKRIPLEQMKIKEGLSLLKANGIDIKNVVVHAPYIINLANSSNESSYSYSKEFLLEEIRRSEGFGVDKIVLHPGNHLGRGEEIAIEDLANALNEIFDKTPDSKVKIAIETMAGKGSEIGKSFEEIAKIISLVKRKDRIGVCLDTCHINDAGYDLHKADEILDEFDRIIGLSKLLLVHLNDSKNPIASHKDRHENLGYGTIGFELLSSFAHNERIAAIPKILETPWVNEKAPYLIEIKMLRENKYIDNWRDSL